MCILTLHTYNNSKTRGNFTLCLLRQLQPMIQCNDKMRDTEVRRSLENYIPCMCGDGVLEQVLAGIPLVLRLLRKIKFLNFHVSIHLTSIYMTMYNACTCGSVGRARHRFGRARKAIESERRIVLRQVSMHVWRNANLRYKF